MSLTFVHAPMMYWWHTPHSVAQKDFRGIQNMPAYLNNAIIVPINKGKDKKPLSANSYRGISLMSVIGKIFEHIVLQRMTPILEENRIPHHAQSAYQAGLSHADPTEVQ